VLVLLCVQVVQTKRMNPVEEKRKKQLSSADKQKIFKLCKLKE
jgi:hypothetical protein